MDGIPDLARFGHAEAWLLGSRLVGACQQRSLPVTISIHLGTQRVFHVGMPGSTTDNDCWTERKTGIVRHFAQPSAEVWERYVTDDNPMAFLAAFALSPDSYFPAGGAVPIMVQGTMVGVLAISGLAGTEDHDLATAALRELKEDEADDS